MQFYFCVIKGLKDEHQEEKSKMKEEHCSAVDRLKEDMTKEKHQELTQCRSYFKQLSCEGVFSPLTKHYHNAENILMFSACLISEFMYRVANLVCEITGLINSKGLVFCCIKLMVILYTLYY